MTETAGDRLRRAVQHYLRGCCNEGAEELWVLAHSKAIERGAQAEDAILAMICEGFIRETERRR